MTQPIEEMTFEAAIAELEAILKRMQSDSCDIDNLSRYAARAIALVSHCRAKLTRTDEELRKCLESLS